MCTTLRKLCIVYAFKQYWTMASNLNSIRLLRISHNTSIQKVFYLLFWKVFCVAFFSLIIVYSAVEVEQLSNLILDICNYEEIKSEYSCFFKKCECFLRERNIVK